jgi:hypothetical protein
VLDEWRANVEDAYDGGFEYDYFRQSRYTKTQEKSLSLYYSLTHKTYISLGI